MNADGRRCEATGSKGFGTTLVIDGVTVSEVLGLPEVTAEIADETADFLKGPFNDGSPSFDFIWVPCGLPEVRATNDE